MKKILRTSFNNGNTNENNKSKNDDENFFNLDKSTKQFMKIMNKYKKHVYTPQKNSQQQRNSEILKAIDKTRLQLENEEKESVYILKEVKNTAMQDKELESLYGTRAKKQFHEVKSSKNNVKLDKSSFFIENYKNKPKHKITLYKNNNQDNIVILPSILGRSQYGDKYSCLNRNKANIFNNNNFNTINNNLTNKNKVSFFSPLKSKNKDIVTFFAEKKRPINFSNYDSKDDETLLSNGYEISKNNFTRSNMDYSYDRFSRNGNISGRESSRKKFALINRGYLDDIENFKDELTFERQKKQKYFEKNDYGCKLSKVRYKFLLGKYFENDL